MQNYFSRCGWWWNNNKWNFKRMLDKSNCNINDETVIDYFCFAKSLEHGNWWFTTIHNRLNEINFNLSLREYVTRDISAAMVFEIETFFSPTLVSVSFSSTVCYLAIVFARCWQCLALRSNQHLPPIRSLNEIF